MEGYVTDEDIKNSVKPELLRQLRDMGYEETRCNVKKILYERDRRQKESYAREKKRKARLVRVGSSAVFYGRLAE